MLMPLERMRVGINSDRASHTHTPGPTAKNAMKQKMQQAVSQPLRVLGTGAIRAFSIFSGAVRRAGRSANGFLKKASTLLAGRPLSRVISTGFSVLSSQRTTFVAAWNRRRNRSRSMSWACR